MTRQLPVRIGYEYPARPKKHQVPCPHCQGVGHGAFCISGVCTPLSRCNTLDFAPKSCAKGAATLGIPAHIACGRCGFAAQKALSQRHTRLSAARRRRFCGSVITHYNTFSPAACKVPWALRGGNGCIECVSGKSPHTCIRKMGTHVRSKSAKFSHVEGVISIKNVV